MIDIKKENFTAVHTATDTVDLDGKSILRVVKKDKIDQYDQNTYARANGLLFHNGTIECRMLSRLLPDAPDGDAQIRCGKPMDASIFPTLDTRSTISGNLVL